MVLISILLASTTQAALSPLLHFEYCVHRQPNCKYLAFMSEPTFHVQCRPDFISPATYKTPDINITGCTSSCSVRLHRVLLWYTMAFLLVFFGISISEAGSTCSYQGRVPQGLYMLPQQYNEVDILIFPVLRGTIVTKTKF